MPFLFNLLNLRDIFKRGAIFSVAYIYDMEQEKRAYNRIKAFLALKGKRGKELAEHLDVSVQTVSKWCTNYSQPSIAELYAVAEFLGVEVCELLEPVRSRQ